MMKSVIILVRLLVISFQAYSDTRGRGDPPLPSLLKLSHTNAHVNALACSLRGG
ncbi:type I toxin-antitoxin system Ibs family toxin [Citrobacter sedlakii]|nr:type I toxin-antitoxin system Ibs family toxin [Citrobacter sedlakii]QUC32333.1 type I toxin-antitoxin system Ibs family toxin [Citrobacter sedlakii]